MTGIEEVAAIAAVAAAAATAAATIAAGQAQAQAGANAKKQAEYQNQLRNAQASAMEQNAGQERATAQRAALEQQRQGRLISSRAGAVASASGGGALDPYIEGDISNETDFRANTALYEGEERARGDEYGAVLQRATGQGELWAGEVAKRAGENAKARSFLTAGGQLASGVYSGASAYERFKPANTLLSNSAGMARYGQMVGDFYS